MTRLRGSRNVRRTLKRPVRRRAQSELEKTSMHPVRTATIKVINFHVDVRSDDVQIKVVHAVDDDGLRLKSTIRFLHRSFRGLAHEPNVDADEHLDDLTLVEILNK